MAAFYFSKDEDRGGRNSAGVLFVRVAEVPGRILYYCDEYDQFWSALEAGRLSGVMTFRKRPTIRPATLTEISAAGLLDMVDGLTGRDTQGRPCTLVVPRAGPQFNQSVRGDQ
jgi:hypothetical protein